MKNYKNKLFLLILCVVLFAVMFTGCSQNKVTINVEDRQTELKASGTIDTDKIRIAPEIGGKVVTVNAAKGDMVAAGDVLFTLDDQIYQTKLAQAEAQISQAEAAAALAKTNKESAQNQYDRAVEAVRKGSPNAESARWAESENTEIDLPNWYFEKTELISALESQVADNQETLKTEQQNLTDTLAKASNQDFVSAESDLNKAQVAFTSADATLTQAKDSSAKDKQKLIDAAQKIYDEAKTKLDAAQKAYDAMLTGSSADDVLEARARVAAVRARLENSQNSLEDMKTRDESLDVEAARIQLNLADNKIDEAQASLQAAQAVKNEVEVSIAKLTVKAPLSGIILANPVKEGETVAAGVTVYEIGQLDQMKLTVYVTENQFGKVKLGADAAVKVDSFPNETFKGTVSYISDEAEYTPRNTQTAESRSSTVFAVEIGLSNPDQKLKPGMPADAVISY